VSAFRPLPTGSSPTPRTGKFFRTWRRPRRGWRWPSSVASWRRAGCARG